MGSFFQVRRLASVVIGLFFMRYSSRQQMVNVQDVVGERIPWSMCWLSSLG
jgi:hypothetical protein